MSRKTYSAAGWKKSVCTVVLVTVCSFSFAQGIKVIGAIPRTNTGKLYQLQIGAFSITSNANSAAETLRRNGLTPQFENRGSLIRVFVVAPAVDVRYTVDRLACAGFKEVIIREWEYRGGDARRETGRAAETRPEAPVVKKPPAEAPVPGKGKAVEDIPFIKVQQTIRLEEMPEHELLHVYETEF